MKNNSSRKSVTQTDFHLFSQAASLIFKFFSIGRFLCIERLVTLNVQLSSWGKRSDERSLSLVYQFTSQDSPLTTHLSLRVIFDRKLYREVLWSYWLNRVLDTMVLVCRHKPITRTDMYSNLPLTTIHCSSFVILYSLLFIQCSLFCVQQTLFFIRYSIFSIHHSPLTTHDSPLTTHHPPLTTHHYTITPFRLSQKPVPPLT